MVEYLVIDCSYTPVEVTIGFVSYHCKGGLVKLQLLNQIHGNKLKWKTMFFQYVDAVRLRKNVY